MQEQEEINRVNNVDLLDDSEEEMQLEDDDDDNDDDENEDEQSDDIDSDVFWNFDQELLEGS